MPCSQPVSVNPKLYEDGIDAEVPQARIFAVGITNFSHLRQTMVLDNVTVSSDFENIVNIPPCFPTALSLWHYRFGIIALKCALKTHFLTRALLGGGAFERPPLRFFEDSKKTAARSAAGFSPTLSPIFSATFVKISTQCHVRSGHQVRSSDPTTK